MLRLSGTSGATLYRVVMLESVLPLVTASLMAAAIGIGVAIPLVKALPSLRNEPSVAHPGEVYYLAMGEMCIRDRKGGVVDALLADHAMFHLEADIRWMDLTEARLSSLADVVNQ